MYIQYLNVWDQGVIIRTKTLESVQVDKRHNEKNVPVVKAVSFNSSLFSLLPWYIICKLEQKTTPKSLLV